MAGLLRSNVPGLRREGPEHFVFPRLLLSSPDVIVRVHDPRISTELVMLDEAHNKLIEADRAFSERCFVRRFARQIKESLVGLHNRPKIPRRVGEYEVVESLEGTSSSRLLRAVHQDGTERFLRLVKKPVTADAERLRGRFVTPCLESTRRSNALEPSGVHPRSTPIFRGRKGPIGLFPSIRWTDGHSARTDWKRSRTARAWDRSQHAPLHPFLAYTRRASSTADCRPTGSS